MAFLWSCFLLFGKVMIGSLLWIMGLSIICVIIGTIIYLITPNPPEPPKGVESEGTDFTWH